jgi:predicted DNA-binding transcriptional regulator AlpA
MAYLLAGFSLRSEEIQHSYSSRINQARDDPMQITDPLMSAPEGATMLDVSVPTFWRRVADGTVPKPIKIGSLSRWPRSEILGVIDAAKARRTDNAVRA